ncbi:histidine kinase [Pseudopedobacter saltans DSM 12145]|uniref:histidine kinase n=1 Tax=Pseudopedobacter saltans (strain ATCC 51119 / DSM 12145 / JCM 21818 / CCUG 39354 / LMG 10337 / NBRC 100064 / NCIMB 13643) TaxID=762903 RepID=F0SEX4_PSESL|nr:hybrid sensor histidine kinase/response regulator transcription factor [Pseudopedobacter saltans]ADY53040.1 histidine kinase [Pseudopedobacter saltans DSM 12145]
MTVVKAYFIMRVFPFISILLIACATQLSFSQTLSIPKDLKFQHFTSVNGLSQRSVIAIIQDKKGYLWLGTRDGLNRFDGHRFVVYKHDINNPKSLSNNNIHAIHQDQSGNLWIGTQNGLNRYNPSEDNFIRYKSDSNQKTITGNIISAIADVEKNIIWVATENGISAINTENNSITRIQKRKNNVNSPSENNTRYILSTKGHHVWICNTLYIDRYNIQTKQFTRFNYPKKVTSGIHVNGLPTLYLDHHNTLWLGNERGLAIFDQNLQEFVDFEFDNRTAITTAVRSITEDLNGNLWIGSYAGLYILSADHSSLKHVTHDDNNPTSLSQNSIYNITRDSRGDMWIGTWADGLNYYNRDNDAFKHILFGTTKNKLNYRVVSGIAEDPSGNLWIGTEGGGLNLYNRKTKTFSYYKNIPNDPNSLSANNVKAVIIDKNKNIWVGIHDGGLNFLNTSQKPYKFQNIDFNKGQNPSLKSYKVLTLCEDQNNNIWIGTLNAGLIIYDTQKKELYRIDKDIRTVMSIVQTENPDVLLVGGSKGVETININTKKRTKITLGSIKKDDPDVYVNCLFIDNKNNYWIGTEGYGIYIYTPKINKIKIYGIKDGLPNDIIYGMLSDNNGNVWASTNNGISRINLQSNTIKNYNQADGLQGNEFNYGSFYKTKNKELFFGGTNGLTYFDANDIRINTFVPTVDINNIEVNNAPYSKITYLTPEIILKYDQNNFSIDFTSLSYLQPEKNEFEYILEGNDKKWNYVGSQRKAVYTNIKAGNYTFRVKGSNNDRLWSSKEATLHIKVLPAPWQTWWAYLSYLGVLVGIVFYIRRLILLRIKERKEKEKSEQISQLKLRLFTDISHDFRTPLTLIIAPLQKMVDEKQGDDVIQQQHNIMLKNAKMLLQLINQVLDFRKSESEDFLLQATESDIISFIKDVKSSFNSLAAKKNIDYQLLVNRNEIMVWFDHIKLKKVLYNLLSNAFKFSSDNSEIILELSLISRKVNIRTVDFIKISITNFGDVIPQNELELIFNQFYQLDNEKKDLGYGIGLSLCKRLVELHHGEISVESSETSGTSFNIFLKLGKDHLEQNERMSRVISSLQDEQLFVIEENTTAKTSSLTEELYTDQIENQTLLIVEDNIDLQQFIEKIFNRRYKVFTASNGKTALEITKENPIDLIISDIQMPSMDGFELCKNIKNNLLTSHIPVILLTAKTSTIHQEEGYYTGADAYITKPFNANILELRVSNLLETRAALIRKFKKDAILEPKNLTVTSPDEIFLEKAITVVEKNISNESFNASIFVVEMGMSRTVIFTKIKALTGQNLSTFIRTIRLKKAGILLEETEMNISQIAYEVGFNDLKYFRECFKEFFKVTPSEYKKNSSV